jgi:hypothetical protein
MMIISWPYDAIHKTHIHFDNDTGEMTLGKAPDWEICNALHNMQYIHIHIQISSLYLYL